MEFSDVLGSVQKERFRTLTNRLLTECYVVKKESKESLQDYLFILQNRELFSSYLDLLGYQLIIQEEYGVIGINNIPGSPASGRIHLRIVDSALLLILRLIYIEEREKISQSQEVRILVDKIYDKYNILGIKGKLDKVTLRSSMSLFKRYHLITNLGADMSNKDTEIIIFPSIFLCIQNQSLTEMQENAKERIEQYTKGNKDDGEFTDDYRRCRHAPERDRHNQREHVADERERGQD